MKPNIYYITFTYSSEKKLNANFYFNAEMIEMKPGTETDIK
jgi:hypothetical protein